MGVNFHFNVIADGRPIKIGSIIDEHTRQCLGEIVDRSITGDHLIDELDCTAAERRTHPAVLSCANGLELAALTERSAGRVGLHFILPGEPGATGT